jgi:hypothetical protein
VRPFGKSRRSLVVIALVPIMAGAAALGLRDPSESSNVSASFQLNEREADGPCSAGRWPEKTLTDDRVGGVRLIPTATTVAALGALPRPTPNITDTTPRLPQEQVVSRVVATLYADHLESDRDIHLVLHDRANPSDTMIAEFPDPRCTVDAVPSLQSLMTKARAAYVRACGAASGDVGDYHMAGLAEIRGVRLFDTIVGQFGRAPNAIELHPVTGFKILGPCRKLGGTTRFDVTSSIAEGSTLSGAAGWSASASSSSGTIRSIEFLVDARSVGAPRAGSAAHVSVDTRTLVDGPHSFAVLATLADGSTTLLVNHVQTRNGVAAAHALHLVATNREARAGDVVRIHARGLLPGAMIVSSLTRLRQRLERTTQTATQHGTAILHLRIPASAPSGRYAITVCQSGCDVIATLPLRVDR